MRGLTVASLLLALTVLVSGCRLLDADTSNERAPLQVVRGEGFQIKLPCDPVRSTESAPVPGGDPRTMHLWTCEDDASAYGISTMRLPKGIPFDLDGAAQGGADAVGGTLASQEKVTFAGVPGRDVLITSQLNGKPTAMFVRILLHRRTLYQVQLLMRDEGSGEPTSRYRKILGSLSFS